MSHPLTQTICLLLVLFTSGFVTTQAQQPKTPEPATGSAPAAHFDRLAAAKTIFIKNTGGNEIPYNVISRAFESWGRYILVDSPDKADIVMEISGPSDDSDKKDSDANKTSMRSGNQQPETATPKDPTSDFIKVMVYDKSHRPMWSAREEPKFAVRHKAADNNLVEASQRIFARFHDRVEPPPKQ